MTKEDTFPSDEERLEAIRRTQEEMRLPEGVELDVRKCVEDAMREYFNKEDEEAKKSQGRPRQK